MATVAADTGRQRQHPRKTHVKVVTASIEDIGEGQQHNLVDTSYGGSHRGQGRRTRADVAEDEGMEVDDDDIHGREARRMCRR